MIGIYLAAVERQFKFSNIPQTHFFPYFIGLLEAEIRHLRTKKTQRTPLAKIKDIF